MAIVIGLLFMVWLAVLVGAVIALLNAVEEAMNPPQSVARRHRPVLAEPETVAAQLSVADATAKRQLAS